MLNKICRAYLPGLVSVDEIQKQNRKYREGGAVSIIDQLTGKLRVTLNTVLKNRCTMYNRNTLSMEGSCSPSLDTEGLKVYTQHCHLTLPKLHDRM